MNKIYIAGSLFTEANIAARRAEAQKLKDALGDKVEIFNPIDAPFNEDKSNTLPTAYDVFAGDYKQISESEYIVFDMGDMNDPGMIMELGIAAEQGTAFVIGVLSDIRWQSSNQYLLPPYGINHFVLGAFDFFDNFRLVHSFDEAVSIISNMEDGIEFLDA